MRRDEFAKHDTLRWVIVILLHIETHLAYSKDKGRPIWLAEAVEKVKPLEGMDLLA